LLGSVKTRLADKIEHGQVLPQAHLFVVKVEITACTDRRFD
jgi:hypothetical protein